MGQSGGPDLKEEFTKFYAGCKNIRRQNWNRLEGGLLGKNGIERNIRTHQKRRREQVIRVHQLERRKETLSRYGYLVVIADHINFILQI